MFTFLENHKDRIWAWAQRNAEGPHAIFWLSAVAFAEASFFPVPPFVLLVAILLSNATAAQRWWYYAGITTFFSVLGGLFGYFIGAAFFHVAGEPLLAFYGLGSEFGTVSQRFSDHAFIAIFTAAFTPIPYKVFTIAAGVFRIDLLVFIIASLLGRGLRYVIMAYALYFFGDHISRVLYKHFSIASFALVTIIAISIYFSVN